MRIIPFIEFTEKIIQHQDPSIEDLNRIEETEQLKRYIYTFPNLILTNFLEFRLYRHGKLIDTVQLSKSLIEKKQRITLLQEKIDDFFNLLNKFFSFVIPQVNDAKTLAIELAKRTRFLKEEVVFELLQEEEKEKKGFILGFYNAFKKYLIKDLSKEDFVDLYSQTITYGLFAARTRSQNGFNRKLAYDKIPHTIGILRDVFKFVSLGELPSQMEWILDDISEVLAVTDVNSILHTFFHEGKSKDPIIHFYETFLAEYDPETREKRGVYYTPEPVVSYIVRSLHIILKEKFGISDGFASEKVTVLDLAGGTLTFLAEATKLAVDEFIKKYGTGKKHGFIKEHILKNFYAFELMMAPYAIGHLKMSFLLEELGYKMKEDERLNLYLTNTLEMEILPESQIPGTASLSEESHLAAKVKKEEPILVIMGNPPYSGHSANKGRWILNQINEYKSIEGILLKEKNPKWIQDDYVKFIRFAQWKIETTGRGLIGMITNHAYLDNPTFRGMRYSLMKTFDEVYIFDLHGNTLKKETPPDGGKDENVFDIRQGVAIALFIKNGMANEKKFYHAEIWGKRTDKYDWLEKNDITTTLWEEIRPTSDFYLFKPIINNETEVYKSFFKITDIFKKYSVGIVTARDSLTIHWTKDEVWDTVKKFYQMKPNEARDTYNLGKDARDWKVELAQKDIKDSGPVYKNIVPIQYRPFDIRYTYYTGRSSGFMCRPRPEIMQHMINGENLALITVRQVAEGNFCHAFVTKHIVESRITISNKGIGFIYPLYLYMTTGQEDLLSGFESDTKSLNFNSYFLNNLKIKFSCEPSPEEIFYYIYAVLYSNIYRTRYNEFLKIDFPRIPFPDSYEIFQKMSGYGEKLVSLHLMKSPDLDSSIARFQGQGNGYVERVKYDKNSERVYINDTQYFEGISHPIWQYQIGGYQVCDKWLKDRKGRELTLEETKHYCRIITCLQKTIKIQDEVDVVFQRVFNEKVKL